MPFDRRCNSLTSNASLNQQAISKSDFDMHPFSTAEMIPNLVFALSQYGSTTVQTGLPHLKSDFPNFSCFDFSVGFDDDVSIVIIAFKDSGIPSGGKMSDQEFENLKTLIGDLRDYEALRTSVSLSKYFGRDRFLLVLNVTDGSVDWHNAQRQMLNWLNDEPVRRAQEMNKRRVFAAIPPPPQFSLSRVQSAMWILECDEAMVQGTAFDLHPFGVVTNEHVLQGATSMIAFRANAPDRRHGVRVLASNPVLDLAIIQIEQSEQADPLLCDNDEVGPMAHVAVCGFPNYRLGDSGVLTPGLIIGHRTISGIQRLLTNAPIVAGMSGGPALGASGKVIGVCVTGSSTFQRAGETGITQLFLSQH